MLIPLRTVKDAAYVLQAIAGKDPHDNYTSAIPCDPLPDYVGACNFSSLRGKRIGVPRNLIDPYDGSEPILAAFEAAIQIIRKAGATIVDNTNVTDYALEQIQKGNSSLIVLDADFITNLPAYLSELTSNPNKVYNLADVRNFTRTFPPEDYPDRNTGVWDDALNLGLNNTSSAFWAAYQNNLEISGRQGILGALANSSLDALILPTTFSPVLPALGGLPVITVPMGFYPPNTTVVKDERGSLAEAGPNQP